MKLTWQFWVMACGTIRYHLHAGGKRTPYFVDKATHMAPFTHGDPVGLFGSGMGEEVRCRDGSHYRIAACLGSFRNVTLAKRDAEERAG